MRLHSFSRTTFLELRGPPPAPGTWGQFGGKDMHLFVNKISAKDAQKLIRALLCSAMSEIRSFSTKLFHHEEHEVLKERNGTYFLHDLRELRGENWVAALPRSVFQPIFLDNTANCS